MHATDIWEQPWIPCEHCPHPTPEACPSRHHRRYCDLVHPDRPGSERAAARLAALSPEHRPGRAVAYIPDPLPDPPARPDAPPPRIAPLASPPPAPRPESETHPWRAVARACPWRVPLSPELAAQYRSCQCREPGDCLLGKATVRPWVGLDTECRACVEATDPPSAPPRP